MQCCIMYLIKLLQQFTAAYKHCNAAQSTAQYVYKSLINELAFKYLREEIRQFEN